VAASFFFGYFVVSCGGAEVSVSGMEAAFGIDKGKDIPLDPSPMLLLIPVVALAVLMALSVPSVRGKLEGAKWPTTLSVSGGAIGLLLLGIAHYAAIEKVKKGLGSHDISSVYHTGLGFKASALAYIAMFVMPFADKMLNKSEPSQNSVPPPQNRQQPTPQQSKNDFAHLLLASIVLYAVYDITYFIINVTRSFNIPYIYEVTSVLYLASLIVGICTVVKLKPRMAQSISNTAIILLSAMALIRCYYVIPRLVGVL
jgi:hypothetical protein